MTLTATRLRANLYRVLERVARSGEAVEVVHRGQRLRVSRAGPGPRRSKPLEQLVRAHPDALEGKLEDLVQLDWSEHWTWR